jgi:hypothetical protein
VNARVGIGIGIAIAIDIDPRIRIAIPNFDSDSDTDAGVLLLRLCRTFFLHADLLTGGSSGKPIYPIGLYRLGSLGSFGM